MQASCFCEIWKLTMDLDFLAALAPGEFYVFFGV